MKEEFLKILLEHTSTLCVTDVDTSITGIDESQLEKVAAALEAYAGGGIETAFTEGFAIGSALGSA